MSLDPFAPEPIGPGAPSNGTRWYCVAHARGCLHVHSTSAHRARTFAGTPGCTVTPDVCSRVGGTLPLLRR